MLHKKKEHPAEKLQLHPRNQHRARYDFDILTRNCPDLKPFVSKNRFGDLSIDFFNPEAVKMLNKALIQQYYHVKKWDIPDGYLCPPIPGRADYIHYMADVLGSVNNNKIPTGSKIKGLDIGIGANAVFPIIGNAEYCWSFVGSDIDQFAIDNVINIIKENAHLGGKIELRLQTNQTDIFKHIIQQDECFDFTICNPPFHSSQAAANAGTQRKLTNLKQQKITKPVLNFGGKHHELWCHGGELEFVQTMIQQSKLYKSSVFWFSTMISKASNLPAIYKALKNTEASTVKTIPMAQGNKTSRIIVWTFLSEAQQQKWIASRWNKKQ